MQPEAPDAPEAPPDAPPARPVRGKPNPRRRLLFDSGAGLLGALLTGFLSPRPVLAHHGFAGKYDFSSPMYLAGRLTNAYIGYPHARLTLEVPADLYLPRDREWVRLLEDAEARQTMSLLRVADRRGAVDISLDQRLTRRLMDETERIATGDPVEAVVYRRTTRDEYRHELHAVLLALSDGRLLVSSSTAVKSR